jgi:hypothetical protein
MRTRRVELEHRLQCRGNPTFYKIADHFHDVLLHTPSLAVARHAAEDLLELIEHKNRRKQPITRTPEFAIRAVQKLPDRFIRLRNGRVDEASATLFGKSRLDLR